MPARTLWGIWCTGNPRHFWMDGDGRVFNTFYKELAEAQLDSLNAFQESAVPMEVRPIVYDAEVSDALED